MTSRAGTFVSTRLFFVDFATVSDKIKGRIYGTEIGQKTGRKTVFSCSFYKIDMKVQFLGDSRFIR
jgi:hypothetical protein